MKQIKRVLCVLLMAVTLMTAAALSAPRAYAAEYEDGDYTVSFRMEGLGRHNIAWDTATVHIDGGAIYVDFTLERVDPRDHAPQYDYLTTPCGTYYPTTNEAAYTCTFSWVQVPGLGRVDVSAMTSAMSQPYEVDYVLYIDDSGIPVKQAAPDPTPSTPSTPSAPSTPSTPSDPGNSGAAEPAAPDTPAKQEDAAAFEDYKTAQKEAVGKLAQSGDSEAAGKLIEEAAKAIDALTYDESKSLEENEKAAAELLTKLQADLAAQRQKDGKAGEKDKPDTAETTGEVTATAVPAKKLSTGAVIGIIAGVVVVAAGVVVALKQRKKK